MSTTIAPFRLKPLLVERVWGSHDLRPWYSSTNNPLTSGPPIGEVWLSADNCLIETGPLAGRSLCDALNHFPLLVKMLFPQDKLSVQVHPGDAYGPKAKTECWYILHAEPGATVALGRKPGTGAAGLARAIDEGTLESLLLHVPVAAGDMVYVPAGTVHAIGPGVVILEVQQNSDTTYRLYDYGRPRELHLEQGLAVTRLTTDAGKIVPQQLEFGSELISVPHFTVQRYDLGAEDQPTASMEFASLQSPQCLVALRGHAELHCGETRLDLLPGHAVVVPAGAGSYSVQGTAELIRCFV